MGRPSAATRACSATTSGSIPVFRDRARARSRLARGRRSHVTAECPRAQLFVALGKRVFDDDIAARRKTALGHGQAQAVVLARALEIVAIGLDRRILVGAANAHIHLEAPDPGGVVARVGQRIDVAPAIAVGLDGLGVGDLDRSRSLGGNGKYPQLESPAAFPFEQRGVAPRPRYPDDFLARAPGLLGRGLVDHSGPDLGRAVLGDKRALFKAILDVQCQAIDLGVGRQGELVDSLEGDVAIVLKGLLDLGARDIAGNAHRDLVARQGQGPVAIAFFAGLERAQLADARHGGAIWVFLWPWIFQLGPGERAGEIDDGCDLGRSGIGR